MRQGTISSVRLGIAHHLGWAVAVTASVDHTVAGRRRIELIEPGVASAPIHHEGKPLDDAATAALVAQVRATSPLAEHADEVLFGPRATMGPPWTKDHRMALAATILAG